MRALRLVAVTAAALVLPAPAGAHVIASPTFLAQGETETIELSVPNERDAPMTELAVTAPSGLEIVSAKTPEGWVVAVVNGEIALWSGGGLASKLSETFELEVKADAGPGMVDLLAEQRYEDGGKVRWRVALTIVPALTTVVLSASASDSAKLLVLLVALGLLVTGGIGAIAWRRRMGS